MVNPKKKQKKKGYVNSGVLYVAQCNVCSLPVVNTYIHVEHMQCNLSL